MKILIVGQYRDWAIERHFVRYMSKLADVEMYAAEDVFDDWYRKTIFNKISHRIGLSSIQQKIAKELLEKAEAVRPDIIWVFKGMRLIPELLKKLKEKGFKLANYNPDHPFEYATRGSGNENVRNSIGLYDLHFCYSNAVAERIENEFGIKTKILPFGYEIKDELFHEIKNTPEIIKACFIGNPDPIRADHLRALAESGIEMDVYGHSWEKYLSADSRLRVFDATYKKDFWIKMRAYRLQINIFRPHNIGSHNMRTFEIPAIGGIMLAPDSPQHRAYFNAGKEAFFYQSKKELIAQAKHVLSLSKEAATTIREKARRRSVEGEYNYAGRAKLVVSTFSNLLNENRLQPELLR
ncbi:MAG: glycosyltransferase [Bacteroidota bacterium]